MICIFCNKEFNKRKTGDHIIPQGLGKFKPEKTIHCICKDCDSKHGNSFERIALRTGLIGFFRSIYGIKSKNNPNSKPHSLSLDKFNAIESQEFSITNLSNPDQNVYIDGNVMSANKILISKNNNVIKSIDIPTTRDIRDICNFIESVIKNKSEGLSVEIQAHSYYQPVFEELKNRGFRFETRILKHDEDEIQIFNISSILTDNHFRFISSIALKSMLYLNYSPSLLQNVIEYIKDGNISHAAHIDINQAESGFDTLDAPPLNNFRHIIEWRISEKHILIKASILAHKNVNGLRFYISFPTGQDNKIIIPYGKIIAIHGDTPRNGTLEIFKGDTQVV
jgi:hypothetical protein